MRNRKVLVVIALVLLALFQAEVASACTMNGIVARVVLLNTDRLDRSFARIYLYNLEEVAAGNADVWFETRNAAIILLALIAMRGYMPVFFRSNATSCPAAGSAEETDFAVIRGIRF